MSEQKPPLIYSKISDAMAEIGVVGKDHKNQQQGYSFRSIDDFTDAVQPVFVKHRIFVSPTILEHAREERTSKSGGHLMTTITKVRFKIYAEDGSFIESDALGEGADSGDKSANKAAATALKYLLAQVFAVRVNGENLDTERETHDYKPKTTQTPPAPKPAPKQATPADVLPKMATEATREWALNHIVSAVGDEAMVNAFLAGKLMTNSQGEWLLDYVPTNKRELLDLIQQIKAFGGIAPATGSDEMPEDIANVIVPIPTKGSKRAEYLKSAQTIGSLYELSHTDEDMRKRLWWIAKGWQPESWTGNNGRVNPPSKQDVDFRAAMDRFNEWHDAKEGK